MSSEDQQPRRRASNNSVAEIERILKEKEYYAILNVEKQATSEEIKKAYRKVSF